MGIIDILKMAYGKEKKVIVVMPAYNASKTIDSVFQRVPKEAFDRISEFIVVNDGSKDSTVDVVGKLIKKYKKIKLINHEKNRGYGGAQKTGFRQALLNDADIVVLLHSDGQYAPEIIQNMIKPIEEDGADIVGGSRLLGGKSLEGGMPLHKYLGNIFLTSLENFVFRANIHSYHSGYKVYSRKALEKIPFEKYSNEFYFDSEMLIGAIRNKFRVVDVPIPTRYGKDNVSYLNSFKYGFDVLNLIFRYLTGKI